MSTGKVMVWREDSGRLGVLREDPERLSDVLRLASGTPAGQPLALETPNLVQLPGRGGQLGERCRAQARFMSP